MTLPEYTTPQDTPITLKDACEDYFRGKMSVATLIAEHRRGKLELMKIGRSYYTTISNLREMEAKCLVAVPARGSGSTASAKRGQSWTAEPGIAQGAALRKLDELKEHFATTSKASTSMASVKRRSLQTY